MSKERTQDRKTFVLVHGAWAGGWAWVRVAERLLARGHRVLAPTLTGVAERSHLARPEVNLTTHVLDIVNELRWKDLEGVVLVGHSYGGFVVTGVAEQLAPRIASIVYVDAFIPRDGQSFADLAPWLDPGPALTPTPPTSPGDYRSEADRKWVDGKATPQTTASLTERLRVTGAYQTIARKTFIRATGWDGPFGPTVDALRADGSWSLHEIACGHDVAIDAPAELVDLLIRCA